jgi:hypothetical protein
MNDAVDYVFSQPQIQDIDVSGSLKVQGDISGPTIEEIHKKIEEGQMTAEELESAVHYIVNMELKCLVIDVTIELNHASSRVYNFYPNRDIDPHNEMKRLGDLIAGALAEATIRIQGTFNNRLEKHGYNS